MAGEMPDSLRHRNGSSWAATSLAVRSEIGWRRLSSEPWLRALRCSPQAVCVAVHGAAPCEWPLRDLWSSDVSHRREMKRHRHQPESSGDLKQNGFRQNFAP